MSQLGVSICNVLAFPCRRIVQVLVCCAVLGSSSTLLAQQGNFQIVWVTVGEALTAGEEQGARAGRQLFTASDLVSMSLDNIKVAAIDVEPIVTQLQIGDRLCLSKLDIRAYDATREAIAEVPLSISVRQDQRGRLGVKRTRRDLCFRPREPGEYPVRLSSLIPAVDGSTRGAQMFIRVAGPDSLQAGDRD